MVMSGGIRTGDIIIPYPGKCWDRVTEAITLLTHKRVDILHELRCMHNDPDSHEHSDPKPYSKTRWPCYKGSAELIRQSVTHPGQEEAPEEPRGPQGVRIG